MRKLYERYGSLAFGIAGMACVLAAAVPYLILGENMVVFYGDQLDGEVLAYILHARYLFTGADSFPELMNGISATGLFPPAPFFVLFYKVLPPIAAFAAVHICCMAAAYIGMYLCLGKMTGLPAVAFFCGVLFAYLPLFPVYGLCQYGQPLLFYALYRLYRGERKALNLGIVFLYGAASSLVLVGYAILGFGLLFLLWLAWKHAFWKHKWYFFGWTALLGTYLVTDYRLLLQIFGIGEQRASHKELIVRKGQDVLASFWTVFFKGTLHTPTHQQIIVVSVTAVFILGLPFYRHLSGRARAAFWYMAGGYLFNFSCALFYAAYQSDAAAQWRNRMGGVIKEFQADRLYWLSASVWYIILGLGLYILWEWAVWCRRARRRSCLAGLAACLSIVSCACAAVVFYYSDFNKGLHRMRLGEGYSKVTWKDFYAPDIFAQIDGFIGRDKSSYRTLSFGIYPAAALYNGFYCLDGYSNNYDLAYHQQFRDIIRGELEKDERLRDYYDTWGCRCYVLSAELGIDRYLVAKGSSDLESGLTIDVGAASEMGAEYLFSAVRIPNAGDLGLVLLREEPFETPDSYYAVYLYALGDLEEDVSAADKSLAAMAGSGR